MRETGRGIAGRIASAFIDSRLTPLIVLASLFLGVGAGVLLPREEETQINVPSNDVFFPAGDETHGAHAANNRATVDHRLHQ